MKTVKSMCIAVAAVIMGGTLAGCGQTKPSGIDVITIWSADSHSKTVYDKLINEFNGTIGKEKNIRIDYQIKVGDAMTQSVQLALETGDAPDLFSTGSLEKYVELGYIAAYDDLPGGKELIEENKDIIRKNSNMGPDGKVYTIPAYATTRGLLYNKEMFKAAGIVDEKGEPKPPETLDEMRECAKKLTDSSKQQYGIIIPMKWSAWFVSDVTALLQGSIGHNGFDYTTGKYDYSSYADVMSFYLGIKEDGSMFPAPESLDNDNARAYFAEGNIGMKLGFSFDVGVLNDQFPAKIDWGVAPLPVIDKDNTYLQRMSQSNTFYMNAESVKDTEKAKKIIEVQRFFLSDEFISAIYQEGVEIPVRKQIVSETKLTNPPKGWQEFADMVAISRLPGPECKLNFEGRTALKDRFINDVWSGDMSAEEAISLYEKDVAAALEEYFKQHPDEKIDDYIDKDWNIKRP